MYITNLKEWYMRRAESNIVTGGQRRLGENWMTRETLCISTRIIYHVYKDSTFTLSSMVDDHAIRISLQASSQQRHPVHAIWTVQKVLSLETRWDHVYLRYRRQWTTGRSGEDISWNRQHMGVECRTRIDGPLNICQQHTTPCLPMSCRAETLAQPVLPISLLHWNYTNHLLNFHTQKKHEERSITK